MVEAYEDEFARLARVYVTNAGYPSIHVYTIDSDMINYLRSYYGARVLTHKGTFDVVLSRRDLLKRACESLMLRTPNGRRAIFRTLRAYCLSEKPEERHRKIALLRFKIHRYRNMLQDE